MVVLDTRLLRLAGYDGSSHFISRIVDDTNDVVLDYDVMAKLGRDSAGLPFRSGECIRVVGERPFAGIIVDSSGVTRHAYCVWYKRDELD